MTETTAPKRPDSLQHAREQLQCAERDLSLAKERYNYAVSLVERLKQETAA